jgi:hypothetical protein
MAKIITSTYFIVNSVRISPQFFTAYFLVTVRLNLMSGTDMAVTI